MIRHSMSGKTVFCLLVCLFAYCRAAPAGMLHDAVKNGNTSDVKLLINNGENINDKDEEGQTPLHIAVKTGTYEMILTLVSSGADINIKNSHGETPLHLAVKINRVGVAELLLANGADPNMQDNDSKSSFQLTSSVDMTNLLTKYCTTETAYIKISNSSSNKSGDNDASYSDNVESLVKSDVVTREPNVPSEEWPTPIPDFALEAGETICRRYNTKIHYPLAKYYQDKIRFIHEGIHFRTKKVESGGNSLYSPIFIEFCISADNDIKPGIYEIIVEYTFSYFSISSDERSDANKELVIIVLVR